MILIAQAMSQLREVYGPHNAETIVKNLAARVVFAPRDSGEAKEISEDLGYTTVLARSVSKPRHFSVVRSTGNSGSVSISEQRRALLLPQEVQHLGAEEEIIFLEQSRPIRARKIRYYEEPALISRLVAPPTVPARRRPDSWSAIAMSAEPDVECFAPSSAVSRLVAFTESEGRPVRNAIENSTTSLSGSSRSHVRPPGPEDIERLDALTLEDFAADFRNLQVPADRVLTPEELSSAVEQFMVAMRE